MSSTIGECGVCGDGVDIAGDVGIDRDMIEIPSQEHSTLSVALDD
jgi:hypothetical protein